jgi:hypothetical protein
MTLTRTIPSLRRTIPDPISRDSRPEFTVASPTDITIAGLSLNTLVDWCGTPCVHTAAAVIPGTGGRPSETELASVVIARVLAASIDRGVLNVWIDAELDSAHTVMTETRLTGRASTAHSIEAVIFFASTQTPVQRMLELPADLRPGDLLVTPCRGVTRLQDVRGRARHPERLSDDRVDIERDAFPFAPCGK